MKIIRLITILVWLVSCCCLPAMVSNAADCPDFPSGDQWVWQIDSDCTYSGDDSVPGNILVKSTALLTIDDGATLGVDLIHNNLTVEDGGGILIQPTGKIEYQSHAERIQIQGVYQHIKGDPDVLQDGTNYYMVGSGDWYEIHVFESTDLETFTLKVSYNPSTLDPVYEYSYIGAPDISKRDSDYIVTFQAACREKGTGSWSPRTTVFYATAPDSNLIFGAPQRINDGITALPRTYPENCTVGVDCYKAMRIDPAYYQDSTGKWMFYTWCTPGNHIASINVTNDYWDDPGTFINHADYDQDFEQGVNEAPDIIKRNGKYYMFYSHGHVVGTYGLSYIMGDSISDLVKQPLSANAHKLYYTLYHTEDPLVCDPENPPVYCMPRLSENAGHSSVVEMGGDYYIFYHVGEIEDGIMQSRSVYRSKLYFNADGTIKPINAVKLYWTGIPGGADYRVDIRPKHNDWITSCADTGVIDEYRSLWYAPAPVPNYIYSGGTGCPSSADSEPPYDLSEINKFRVCYSTDGWSSETCMEADFTYGTDEDLNFNF